ncbi:MAG: hypothetical protein AAF489_10065 [Bacteroidota bacterium]
MKTFNPVIFTLLFAMSLTTISCVRESAGSKLSDVPYFQFETSDYNNLLQVYETEEEFVAYQNQFNEVIRFKITRSTLGREGKFTRGNFFGTGGGALVYFFDAQRIHLELTEWPDDYKRTEILIQKTIENKLEGSIRFPLWNDNTGSSSELPNTIFLNFNTAPMTLILNNVTYDQVFEIVSENNEPLGPLGPYQRNINVLYYDIRDGIIGFNDLDGGQWRLVN